MDTHRGLVTTVVILSIAVLLLALPRLGTVRTTTTRTSTNALTASTVDLYTTTGAVRATPQLHFGNLPYSNLQTTIETTPRPQYYYYYTTTTTPQLPDETGYGYYQYSN